MTAKVEVTLRAQKLNQGGRPWERNAYIFKLMLLRRVTLGQRIYLILNTSGRDENLSWSLGAVNDKVDSRRIRLTQKTSRGRYCAAKRGAS